MHIELTNNYCKVKLEEDGKFKEKIVDLSQLLDELSVYKATNFGLLPKDVRIIESMGNSMVIGIEFPKKTWKLVFEPYGGEGKTFGQVSLPGGILFEKVSREAGGELKHVRTHIYATRGKRIMFNHDRLFNFPTPNVYDNGKVCWGNVKLGNIKHLSAVEGVVNSFFTNKFNSDLFHNKVNTNFPGPTNSALDYLKYLDTNEFNDDWLQEYDIPVGKIASKILKD